MKDCTQRVGARAWFWGRTRSALIFIVLVLCARLLATEAYDRMSAASVAQARDAMGEQWLVDRGVSEAFASGLRESFMAATPRTEPEPVRISSRVAAMLERKMASALERSVSSDTDPLGSFVSQIAESMSMSIEDPADGATAALRPEPESWPLSLPPPVVLRCGDWEDPESRIEYFVVTLGYLTPATDEWDGDEIPAAAWRIPVAPGGGPTGSDRPIQIDADALPTYRQLLDAHQLAMIDRGRVLPLDRIDVAKLEFVIGRPDLKARVGEVDAGHAVIAAHDMHRSAEAEAAAIRMHLERIAAELAKSSLSDEDDAAIVAHVRRGVARTILRRYTAPEHIMVTRLDGGGRRVFVFAGRSSSGFGVASPAGNRSGDRWERYATIDLRSDGMPAVSFDSSRTPEIAAEFVREVIIDPLGARAREHRAERPWLFGGLNLRDSPRRTPLAEYLTSPSLPDFSQVRVRAWPWLREYGFPVPNASEVAAALDRGAIASSPDLAFVEILRAVNAHGSMLLFRMASGPLQWICAMILAFVGLLAILALIRCALESASRVWLTADRSTRLSGRVRSLRLVADRYLGRTSLARSLEAISDSPSETDIAAARRDLARAHDSRGDGREGAFAHWAWHFPQLGLVGTLASLGLSLGLSSTLLAARDQVEALLASDAQGQAMSTAIDSTLGSTCSLIAYMAIARIVAIVVARSRRRDLEVFDAAARGDVEGA